MKSRILLCILFLLSGNLLLGQTYNQLGSNINGVASDNLGGNVSISSDGNIMAIGSPGHIANTNDLSTGQVKVFELVNNDWVQKGPSLVGEVANDSYGSGLDISDDGNILVIGAPNSDGNGGASSFTGRIYIYEWSGSDWSLLQTLNGASGENFGSSISVSSDGSFLAAGAPNANGGGSVRGAVRVYQRAASTWNQVGNDVNGSQDSESAGRSVSLKVTGTDKVLAVGGPGYSSVPGNFDEAGVVRIYRESAGSWGNAWTGSETIIGTLNSAWGGSVDFSDNGSRLAVGAPNGLLAGDPNYVEVYEFNASSTPKWQVLGSRINSNHTNGDFGKNVGVSGDGSHLVVGAPASAGTGKENGYTKLFKFESSAWTELDSIPGAAANDEFGSSVAINADGSQYSVGAQGNDTGGDAAGQVQVYELFVPDVIAPTVTISSSAGAITNTNPLNITITFSEEVTGFEAADISVANATVGALNTTDDIVYTADITFPADGEYSISVAASALTDVAGNNNEASNTLAIEYDNTDPVVTINEQIVTTTGPITLTGTIVETNLDSLFVTVGSTEYPVAEENITGESWSFTINSLEVGIYDLSARAVDSARNEATASIAKALIYDVTKPIVSIEGLGEVIFDDSVKITIRFSEGVSDFETSDIQLTKLTKSSLTLIDSISASVMVKVDDGVQEGDSVSITIADNAVNDIAGLGNAAITISAAYSKPYSGGLGTEDNPFLISNVEDYIFFTQRSQDWDSFFLQTQDIDFENTSIGRIGTFNGKYNGGGNTLMNYNINYDAMDESLLSTGLIETIGALGEVTNLKIVNNFEFNELSFGENSVSTVGFCILAKQNFGLVKGLSYQGDIITNGVLFKTVDYRGLIESLNGSGRIEDTYMNLNVNLKTRGFESIVTASGLVYEVKADASVVNCTVEGSINIEQNANLQNKAQLGGLVFLNSGLVLNSRTNLNLRAKCEEGDADIGGIVYRNNPTGQISMSRASGTLVADGGESGSSIFSPDDEYPGGIAKANAGTIEKCYFTGSMDGDYSSGLVYSNTGIVNESFVIGSLSGLYNTVFGSMNSGSISNCYSWASVEASFGGGLVLTNDEGTISNSYKRSNRLISDFEITLNGNISNTFWLSETGEEASQSGIEPKTEAELKTIATFEDAGWDISSNENSIWRYYPFAYPVHNWTLQQNDSITLAGTVVINDSNDPLGNEKVTVTSLIGGNVVNYSTTLNASGEFSIKVPSGLHLVSIQSNDYQKTYYGNTNNLFKALSVSFNLSNMRIQMIPIGANLLTGNGKLTGRVVRNVDGNDRILTGRYLDGEGIADLGVSLIRVSDGQLMVTVSTDTNGNYEIEGIPAGEYEVQLSVIGKEVNLEGSTFTMDEEGTPVIISAAVNEDGIIFGVEDILGIDNKIEVSVYPNPVRDFVNVQIPGKAVARIIDVNGTVLKEESFTDNLKLNISALHSNMYFLEISNAKGKAMKKLVKM
ncbi:Por secretion system C-terminal sorting domain-containing protein [Marivirga sericea]|uniref:Por secretion system C-terminal sorting domain-containing protein n=1 Tax=Marivirga sericea TaxID=1028 RepID=A0A1X7K2V5_9BACT|nr:Ig-like domain-containing protein [Marivirga sericea]SMG35299.1 Por secretion system C-terminal sorting domain-containing protein [Marivirga sericea]